MHWQVNVFQKSNWQNQVFIFVALPPFIRVVNIVELQRTDIHQVERAILFKMSLSYITLYEQCLEHAYSYGSLMFWCIDEMASVPFKHNNAQASTFMTIDIHSYRQVHQ